MTPTTAAIDAAFATWPEIAIPAGGSFKLTIASISITVGQTKRAVALRIDTNDRKPTCPACSTEMPGRRTLVRFSLLPDETKPFDCGCGTRFYARKLRHGGWRTVAFQ